MPDISLGEHFDSFVQEQLARGRFRDVGEVLRAGLRLLEDQETSLVERRADLRRSVEAAFDDPRPSIPAEEVFSRLRADIRAGLDSVPAEPLEMDEIKVTAHQQRKMVP